MLAQAPGFGGGGPSSRAAHSPCLRSELHGGALPTTVAGHAPSSRGERRSSKEKSQDPSPTAWRGSVPPRRDSPPPIASSTASLSYGISSRGGIRIRRASLSPPPPVMRQCGSGVTVETCKDAVEAGGRLQRSGGQPATGPTLCCCFSFFFVLFAMRLNTGA
jgi:hypothetical protein